MSLVIPQGNNRRVRKTLKLSIRKKAVVDIATDSYKDPLSILSESFEFNGKTPIYLIWETETNTVYADIKPFTLEEAKKELEEEE